MCPVISSTVMSDKNASSKGQFKNANRKQKGLSDKETVSANDFDMLKSVHVVRSGRVTAVRWALAPMYVCMCVCVSVWVWCLF